MIDPLFLIRSFDRFRASAMERKIASYGPENGFVLLVPMKPLHGIEIVDTNPDY